MNADIFIPTQEKFEEILDRKLNAILKERIPEIIRRANRKEYITTNEFKDLTGCSHRIQQYMRDENKIPFSQEGRKIFYKTTDVEKFMDDRRIEATEG